MKKFKFIVHERPMGKGRPRHNTKTGHTYTPYKTEINERIIKQEALFQLGNNLNPYYTGEIAIRIIAKFKPNVTEIREMKRKNINLIGKGYMKKPDFDNITKIICDALNNFAYKDDTQITKAEIIKEYAEEDCIEVEIDYLEG